MVRLLRRLLTPLLVKDDAGQAIVEFAVAAPLQLLVVFGLMQLSLLYVSALTVNYTAYRCARSALTYVEPEDPEADGAMTRAETVQAVAATLLAPLTGPSVDGGAPLDAPVVMPGWGEIHRSDIAASKVRVTIEDPDPAAAEQVITARVEYEQELFFPVVDRLYRYLMRRDEDWREDPDRAYYLFGTLEANRSEEVLYNEDGELIDQGAIVRLIGGRTHVVVRQQCSLAADMGWRGGDG